VTAWVRSPAPSFCRMFWTWIFIVPSARPRAVAISGGEPVHRGAGQDAGQRVVQRLGHVAGNPHLRDGRDEPVVARDGVPTTNLVWKDTAIIPVGSTVDLLIDASNPGAWMLHCHIAEHLGAGMMAVLHVDP